MKRTVKPIITIHERPFVSTENGDYENMLSAKEMRPYEKPIIEIIPIEFCDIITASNNNWETDPFPLDDNVWLLPNSHEF